MQLNWSLNKITELNSNELWQIYNLRDKVFIVEQKSPYLDADRDDLDAYHLRAVNDKNELVAYSRFFKINANEVTFGRVVIDKSLRDHGLGEALINKTLADITNVYGKINVRIEAQFYAVNFYRKFGFEVVGEPFLDTGIKHVEMVLK